MQIEGKNLFHIADTIRVKKIESMKTNVDMKSWNNYVLAKKLSNAYLNTIVYYVIIGGREAPRRGGTQIHSLSDDVNYVK